ncbi:hypothetical protein AtNW77_Chr2g0253871 [Arabidopsis thaliana]
MTTMATQGAWLRMTSSAKSMTKSTVTSKELGFLTSQLSGLRISYTPSDVINRISLPSFPGIQPIVARNSPFPFLLGFSRMHWRTKFILLSFYSCRISNL